MWSPFDYVVEGVGYAAAILRMVRVMIDLDTGTIVSYLIAGVVGLLATALALTWLVKD